MSHGIVVPPNENQQKPKGKKTFWEKFKFIITHITVEPIVFLYTVSMLMNLIVTQNLSLEKACRVNLNLTKSICDAMVLRNKSGYLPYQEVEVQQVVVKWAAYKAFLVGSIPVIGIIFLGSWSDRHRRRKPIILIAMFGDLIANIGLFVCSYYLLEISIEYSWAIDTIPVALCGAQCSLHLGVFSYVGGLCSEEDRTLRIASLTITHILALPTGMFMSGMVLHSIGFLGAYSVIISFLTISIVYGIFMIEEKKFKEEETTKKGFLKDLFAVEYVKNTFKICFQKRDDNRRTRIIALMILSTMIQGPMDGERPLQYMYVRLKCGWNEVDFSIFNAFHFCVQISGNLFALLFFSKYLKWDDAILGIIAAISKASACLVYAFAPSGTFFYIGALFEIFFGAVFIAMRAIMAKVVPPHELGQSNSIFGITEGLMPFIFGPVYSNLYLLTLAVFPGSFYLLSSGINVITLHLFLYLYKSDKKKAKLLLEKQKVSNEVNIS
ncbi:hypothetical protein HHI36_003460 [Cryptolaemus montrouzieri]|uniref:Solute carrier family 46 member 3 n=1 Tax=Cryptolaemus montrouzieri TaxID=559131 RepID=A0ABD2PE73_9CUCU